MKKELKKPLKEGQVITVKLGYNLIKKLDFIVEQEGKRGNVKCSRATAGEILSNRIDKVGGLKEET